jgi:hypothetical protein
MGDLIFLFNQEFCRKCGAKLIIVQENKACVIKACPLCDLPVGSPELPPLFKNHCWNCGGPINSDCCVPSETPGMGYHCPLCGKDLREFYDRR